jgi:single-stranded-DNA-specific exonuclease
MTDVGRAKKFLQPKLAELTLPDAMADREVAAKRLARAIKHHERIVVFGDYDVDGITSAALLSSVIKTLGGQVHTLVASRFEGGYGFSDQALDKVLALGPSLLVTCDCGTSDHARLHKLARRGIDAIVIDHHLVPEEKLPVMAFLNPHRKECGFAYKGLASVGLAFNIAAALRAELGVPLDLREYLELVALGTIADVAPLTGDNRILTRAGLERLSQRKARMGVLALLRQTKLTGAIKAVDVGFSIAPMLNAPGRLGSPDPTLRLLLSQQPEEAERAAKFLSHANIERREISQKIAAEALAIAQRDNRTEQRAGIVVAQEGWHEGMVGIVAGRLTERMKRPCIVVSLDGERGTGSARAPKGWPLHQLVQSCADLLVRFGGHDGACGMTIERGRLDTFREAFSSACDVFKRTHSTVSDALELDTELTAADLEQSMVRSLNELEPSGQECAEAHVVLHDAKIEAVRSMSYGHMRARVTLGGRPLSLFLRDGTDRIAQGELDFVEGKRYAIAGKLRPDSFSGPDALQLEVLATR